MWSFYKNHQNLSKKAGVLETNKAQNEQSKEQGRSMVEMLGVLAIIGVLSVGAISGYRYAMNKYRANRVTNELNLLSHQVAIAMMSKNGVSGELKLGEPYDTDKKLTTSGYSFEFGCGDGTTGTCNGLYHFKVKGVSEGVCKELVQMREHLQYSVTRPETCVTGTSDLTYVFELPDAAIEEEYNVCNDHGDYDETTGACTCDAGYSGTNCEMDQTCSGHGTFDGERCTCTTSGWRGINCEIKIGCNGNGYVNYGGCSCQNGWTGVNCETETNDKTCGGTAQKSCPESGQYCKANPSNCYVGAGSEKEESIRKQAEGTCHNALDEMRTITIKGKTLIVSKNSMDWWSAERFCKAIDARQVSLTDLGCTTDGCDDDLYNGFQKYGIEGGWTSTTHAERTCAAYCVFSSGHVTTGVKNNSYRAVCQ